jgi:hypothetical protein
MVGSVACIPLPWVGKVLRLRQWREDLIGGWQCCAIHARGCACVLHPGMQVCEHFARINDHSRLVVAAVRVRGRVRGRVERGGHQTWDVSKPDSEVTGYFYTLQVRFSRGACAWMSTGAKIDAFRVCEGSQIKALHHIQYEYFTVLRQSDPIALRIIDTPP